MYRLNNIRPCLFGLGLLLCLGGPAAVFAHGNINEQTLQGVKVPVTPGLIKGKKRIVVDPAAAVQLGKALFWDANVGSDGVACATCHFHAGSDRRTRNQLEPGSLNTADPNAARTFEINASGDGSPDYELKAADFPLFRLADPANKFSTVLFSTDDVVASAGSFLRDYQTVNAQGDGNDQCAAQSDQLFHVDGLNARQATKRNAPTVINAVFNFRNFWDGRANNLFNGQSAFGPRDVEAGVWIAKKGKRARKKSILLKNASLASQAVAPPMDQTEMSCRGRTFAELGRKLLQRRPLETQAVHAQDSVLGAVRDGSGFGLAGTYENYIKKAFAKRFWSGQGDFGTSASGHAYTQAEANFAFFFGLAIQLYESTLVSDQTLFDQNVGDDGFPIGYDDQQKRGLTVFQDAHCNNCHSGPIFSAAVNPEIHFASSKKKNYYSLVNRTVLTEQTDQFGVDHTLVDTGFSDTSVVPNDYDVGLGGTDPFGNPLSFTEQYLLKLADPSRPMADPVKIASCQMDDPFVIDFFSSELTSDRMGRGYCKGHKKLSKVPAPEVVRAELDKANQGRISMSTVGAFKIPTLRNIELTGPYMHNGSMKSLEEVVEFYNRGGNVTNRHHASTLVFAQGLLEQQKADLVAFLKTLTDERVRWERAPFDHPELKIAHGHEKGINPIGNELANDAILHIPAVGQNGRTPAQGPLRAFDSYLQP